MKGSAGSLHPKGLRRFGSNNLRTGHNQPRHNTVKGILMTLSDDLSKLAARAKAAENRFAAAQQDAHAKLQQDVQSARDALQKGTDQLREAAEANQGKVAAWWSGVQNSWDDEIASIRRDVESKKAEHDLKAAQRRANDAEEDAKFAIAYAYWAVEEAEYRVLDAVLARADADSMAGGGS